MSSTGHVETAASPESVGMSADRLARIAPVMQSYIDDGTVAGISTRD